MNIRRVPIRSSNQSPIYMKAYIFISKWKAPICMKLQVMARHQSPVRVSGPKSAPHFSKASVEGSRIPTPKATIKIKIRRLRSIRIGVAINPFRGMKKLIKDDFFSISLRYASSSSVNGRLKSSSSFLAFCSNSSGERVDFISSIAFCKLWMFFLFLP